MTNHSIIRILREAALLLKHEFNPADLRFVEINNRHYAKNEFGEFKNDLIEAGSKMRMLFLEQNIPAASLTDLVKDDNILVLVFHETPQELVPLLISCERKKIAITALQENTQLSFGTDISQLTSLHSHANGVVTYILYPYKNLVSDYAYEGDVVPEPMSPVRRFFRLLSTERKDILYILFYSIVVGLIGLILPVGIQNTVELISGGVFFSSVYLLIAAVILGVLFTGILQIIQIGLVEHLQRRVFTKAAIEFAFRIPRIRMESILNNYAPELVNRFFDVITLQKGLPKMLIDLSSAAIQIFFGLILLSLYHPFFVFFSVILVFVLFLIFWLTGANGLTSSINESKYKYKVVQWLEELARSINSFKLAGNTDLPIRRTDNMVNNYLKYRKAHFQVLITQFSFIVVFKTAVTASLLILGTILVVNREITLGQFVASEVIIILMLNAVEKTITYMDVIYDLLTAVDKIAQLTDLPLEKVGGLDFQRHTVTGYSIELKQLKYRYPQKTEHVLNGIDLRINSGERVCIAGPGNAGKTTLTNLIAGIHSDYEGIITINNYSLRDLDIRHLRDSMAKNISPEDIFDGTILENITLGSATRSVEDAIQAIRKVKLEDEVNRLPEGLNTHIVSGGKGFSSSFIHKLILARCLAKKPALIILNDFFAGLKRQEKLDMLQSVIHADNRYTLLAVSNDPLIMAACDRVILLSNGQISEEGHFEELLKKGTINNYID
ncbi:peptidase domain-containing ABC transporter [Ohtaekwangia koreensis]|uniref:ABC-type bacteriocin/lantibiotic exporter, contains an N-terminal double-glycine peptidase domain n=1 Tax=Ohtaekwangia koreensis TaxID=688867 RepID=A0A1T5KHZ9_9BACT|nr:ABC transporter ATP-binding protein [Ohtaekwangia koreensis]SKC63270.1 ABC-type bacteriocin/lantibiotic exporter, contains an N-terminal double-glycine peptidase domain [Ohtaekwangia koreensis]